MQSSSVGIDTGLLVHPLVGLGILRDSLSRKITFRLFPVSVESKSCFSFILSVLGNRQIREGMSENKLVRKT